MRRKVLVIFCLVSVLSSISTVTAYDKVDVEKLFGLWGNGVKDLVGEVMTNLQAVIDPRYLPAAQDVCRDFLTDSELATKKYAFAPYICAVDGPHFLLPIKHLPLQRFHHKERTWDSVTWIIGSDNQDALCWPSVEVVSEYANYRVSIFCGVSRNQSFTYTLKAKGGDTLALYNLENHRVVKEGPCLENVLREAFTSCMSLKKRKNCFAETTERLIKIYTALALEEFGIAPAGIERVNLHKFIDENEIPKRTLIKNLVALQWQIWQPGKELRNKIYHKVIAPAIDRGYPLETILQWMVTAEEERVYRGKEGSLIVEKFCPGRNQWVEWITHLRDREGAILGMGPDFSWDGGLIKVVAYIEFRERHPLTDRAVMFGGDSDLGEFWIRKGEDTHHGICMYFSPEEGLAAIMNSLRTSDLTKKVPGQFAGLLDRTLEEELWPQTEAELQSMIDNWQGQKRKWQAGSIGEVDPQAAEIIKRISS